MSSSPQQIEQERLRRRTFAIISHPDAGKTTLTEKLLLFGGSIEIAGAVRGRKSQRSAKSDWMELEKQRGISVSSTVLTFEYLGKQINLLDTPGHHDFSEDTYRTLMAADAAVMVIDAAKGIETQTEKLFRVCAARKIPVITFVNKIDRPGTSPLEILSEIEKEFSIQAVPVNWPVGCSKEFLGIVDIASDQLHVFLDKTGDRRGSTQQLNWTELANGKVDIDSLRAESEQGRGIDVFDEKVIDIAKEELELIELAGHEYSPSMFLAGQQTPVFFGSALTNYGMELFLKGFIERCPPPGVGSGTFEQTETPKNEFSGFIFKIQANLDPMHRDRVAFVRIGTGRFERDMDVVVERTGNRVRLPRALKIFGRERQTMDEAYPGDIIGVVCPGELRLGDTLFQGEPIRYPGVPQFSPEVFASVTCPDTSRRKQFDRGIQQLVEEGAIQLFFTRGRQKDAILAAVGELQFDVVQFRLESEYNAPSRVQWLPYKHARWYRPKADADLEGGEDLKTPYGAKLVTDSFNSPAILLQSEWDLKTLERENPGVAFESIHESRTSVADLTAER
ncbi:MAG: peptide chain release factor 3 [Pirellula sp.]|jgi:peptide chain release factor 3